MAVPGRTGTVPPVRSRLTYLLAPALLIGVAVGAVTILAAKQDAAPSYLNSGTSTASTDTGATGSASFTFTKDRYRPTVADIPALTAEPQVRQLYTSIRACFDPDATRTTNLYEQAPCYEALIKQASATLEPIEIYNAVNALVAERPDLFAACHTGGHIGAVGLTERIWDPTASYDEQLAQFDRLVGSLNDVCQNGFIHGFYDAIGYAQPGMDSFRAAAEICNRITLPFVDCGHGLGHSAWIATKDTAKAAAICGLFRDDKRYSCDDGVIMYVGDLWREEGMSIFPSDREFDAAAYYQRIPGVCDTWPTQRAGDTNPRRGCWAGIVAGLIFRPISTLIIEADNDYFAVADTMRTLARLGEQACIELGAEGEWECMFAWRSNVMFAAANNEAAIRDFCGALRKHAAYCTELSLTQLATERGDVTESSRNKPGS